jgi:uncharacterized protein
MTLHVPNLAPQPTGQELDRFWEFTAAGEVRLPRCGSCGRWLPVSIRRCPDDGAMPDWQLVPSTGRVYSMTVVHHSFLPAGSTEVPYAVALVELDGVDGVRLLAAVEAESPTAVQVGTAVRLGLHAFDTHTLPIVRVDAVAEKPG